MSKMHDMSVSLETNGSVFYGKKRKKEKKVNFFNTVRT